MALSVSHFTVSIKFIYIGDFTTARPLLILRNKKRRDEKLRLGYFAIFPFLLLLIGKINYEENNRKRERKARRSLSDFT